MSTSETLRKWEQIQASPTPPAHQSALSVIEQTLAGGAGRRQQEVERDARQG
jgi:hypothetical protein